MSTTEHLPNHHLTQAKIAACSVGCGACKGEGDCQNESAKAKRETGNASEPVHRTETKVRFFSRMSRFFLRWRETENADGSHHPLLWASIGISVALLDTR